MDLEQKLALMKKYDFSKFSSNLPEERVYPHGFVAGVNGIKGIAWNINKGHYANENLKKRIDILYLWYGCMRSCYDTIDFGLIANDKDFDLLRQVNQLLPKLGKTIYQVALAAASSNYKNREQLKTAASNLNNVSKKLSKLDYESYRFKLEELEKQLEAK